MQLSKYTFNSAHDSYYSMMNKVANNLANYGVRIKESIGTNKFDKIRSYNSENKCE